MCLHLAGSLNLPARLRVIAPTPWPTCTPWSLGFSDPGNDDLSFKNDGKKWIAGVGSMGWNPTHVPGLGLVIFGSESSRFASVIQKKKKLFQMYLKWIYSENWSWVSTPRPVYWWSNFSSGLNGRGKRSCLCPCSPTMVFGYGRLNGKSRCVEWELLVRKSSNLSAWDG